MFSLHAFVRESFFTFYSQWLHNSERRCHHHQQQQIKIKSLFSAVISPFRVADSNILHWDVALYVSCDTWLPYSCEIPCVCVCVCVCVTFYRDRPPSCLASQTVSCINKMRRNGRRFDTPQFRVEGRRLCFSRCRVKTL